MSAKEMILTGLALSALAAWEMAIGEIPLGLFSIGHEGQTTLFNVIIVLKLLVAALLLSRGLLRIDLPLQRMPAWLRSILHRSTGATARHTRP